MDWWRRYGWRGHIASALVILLLLFAVGCNKHRSWEALYSAAQESADQRSKLAAQLADRGFQQTVGDSVVNYKFRVLKAELGAYDDRKQALQLLEVPPPPELASGEFAVRRKIVQCLAAGYSGDFSQSDLCFEKVSLEASSKAPELLPKIFYSRGVLAKLQENWEAAEKDYGQAANLARRYHQHFVEADALVTSAHIQMDLEQYDSAIDTLNSISDQSSLQSTRQAEMISGDLGWSFYNIGELSRAVSYLTDAERASAKIGQSQDQQLWSLDLGVSYFSQGDYNNAEKSYLNANEISKTLRPNKNGVMALHNLAQLELKRNNVQKADDYNRQAIAAENSMAAKSTPDGEYVHGLCTLTTAEIAVRRHKFSEAEQLLSALGGKTKDSSLRWQAQSDLANLYVTEKEPVKAALEFEAAIRTLEKARERVQQEEQRMSILDGWPFYDDYIRFLIGQHQDQKALGVAEFSRARTLAEGLRIVDSQKPAQLSVQKVQQLLKQHNRTILAYWLSEPESYLWLLSPSNFKAWRLPATKGEIEKLIEEYNTNLVDHKDIDELSNGQKLYDILIRPAEKLIPRKTRVIIIPHRSLNKLNFETLVVPSSKPRYWIEDFTIEVAGSVSLLVDAKRTPTLTAKRLLLMGAPVQVSDEFPVLPNAQQEIDKVKTHFLDAEEVVIPGKEATPSAYRSSHPESFGVIHFVTHGIASDRNPLDSAIILSPQADGNFKLYARDIIGIPIKADVVVISACSSAGTRAYSGEGLVGLVWAFLRAGSHQVVGALWDVDDLATPDFMDNFYSALKDNRPAEALRDAKLKMLRSGTIYHLPYYWATLQLYAGS